MATDIETKIAKLLAMAEGTTNQHEAETFMAKAEELMLAHGIERAQLEAKAVGAARKTTPTTAVCSAVSMRKLRCEGASSAAPALREQRRSSS